jgi:acylphosphatase
VPQTERGPSGSDTVRARVHIGGRVQGVYFRASASREASSRGLAGWVRNTAQGVEAVFEGPAAAVESAIAWCHEGPPHAVVESVEVRWEAPEGLQGFRIRH